MQTAEIEFENLTNMTQLGVEPGDTGSATVTREEAFRLRDRGAIKIVGDDTIVDQGETGPPEPTPQGVPDPPELIAEEEAARGEGEKTPEEIAADDEKAAEEAEAEKTRGRGGRGR